MSDKNFQKSYEEYVRGILVKNIGVSKNNLDKYTSENSMKIFERCLVSRSLAISELQNYELLEFRGDSMLYPILTQILSEKVFSLKNIDIVKDKRVVGEFTSLRSSMKSNTFISVFAIMMNIYRYMKYSIDKAIHPVYANDFENIIEIFSKDPKMAEERQEIMNVYNVSEQNLRNPEDKVYQMPVTNLLKARIDKNISSYSKRKNMAKSLYFEPVVTKFLADAFESFLGALSVVSLELYECVGPNYAIVYAFVYDMMTKLAYNDPESLLFSLETSKTVTSYISEITGRKKAEIDDGNGQKRYLYSKTGKGQGIEKFPDKPSLYTYEIEISAGIFDSQKYPNREPVIKLMSKSDIDKKVASQKVHHQLVIELRKRGVNILDDERIKLIYNLLISGLTSSN